MDDDRASVDDRATPDDGATIARLAGDLLPALIARLDASDLGELEVRGEGWRIRLRKPFDRRRAPVLAEARRRRGRHPEAPEAIVAAARIPVVVSTAPASAGPEGAGTSPSASGPDPASPQAVVPEAEDLVDESRLVATSPAVGYFVPREGIGAGRPVRAGDIVAYVDCLGVRQEVLAPVDGVLGRTIAQPGEAVEYGQPLVRIGLAAPGSA